MSELYKKYRPKTLAKVLGQTEAVKTLTAYLEKSELPHAVMLHGPSGCGKTTLARILATEVGCPTKRSAAYVERNCADERGIQAVRQMADTMALRALGGGSRVWVLDEVHMLTREAQNALLKPLEDTPEHVYFILATTDPKKVIPTVRNRCTQIQLKPLTKPTMSKLVNGIAKKEKIKIGKSVHEAILDVADGSPRRALVLLDQVARADNQQTALALITKEDEEVQSIDLCRAIMGRTADWPTVCAKLAGMQQLNIEGIRRSVMGYANSILLKGNTATTHRAALVIELFNDIRYDSPFAAVTVAAYNVFHDEG